MDQKAPTMRLPRNHVRPAIGMDSLEGHVKLVRKRSCVHGYSRLRIIRMIVVVVHDVDPLIVFGSKIRVTHGLDV